MKVSLVSLRAEFGTSGERQSTMAMRAALESCGVVVHEAIEKNESAGHRALALRNIFEFQRLRRISRLLQDRSYDRHFVKIPTAAQLPILDVVARGAEERLVVLLDSVCAGRRNAGSLLRELRHEPIYALGKRIVNFPGWARLSRLRPKAVVCGAQAQVNEAQRLLGRQRCHYWVIPNASVDSNEPVIWNRNPAEPYVIGYLGHPYAYKGCVDVIESAPLLPSSSRCVFRAAFSFSGRPSVRHKWLKAGGDDLGVVDVGRFLASIHILCVPLYTEFGTMVFPNVLLEAMRAGVPTVTTRSPISVELFGGDAPVGWLDDVNPTAVARAIRELLKADLQIVAARLRDRYRHFDRERTRQRWREFVAFLAEDGDA